MARGRYDLPLDKDASARYLPWIVAPMAYLAALALAGALLATVMAWHWSAGLSSAVTVILPASDRAQGPAAERRAELARAALAAVPGVAQAVLVDPAAVAARLEPWLGAGALADELPLPVLIELKLASGRRLDLEAARTAVGRIEPGAVVDDHVLWRRQIAALGWRAAGLGLLAVALIAVAGAAVIVFATRAALAVHHETIEVLHLIGAHDDYIADQFRRHARKLALRGGAIALGLLALTAAAAWSLAAQLDPSLLPRLGLAPWQWAIIGTLPAALAMGALLVLATVAARHTVLRALARLV